MGTLRQPCCSLPPIPPTETQTVAWAEGQWAMGKVTLPQAALRAGLATIHQGHVERRVRAFCCQVAQACTAHVSGAA